MSKNIFAEYECSLLNKERFPGLNGLRALAVLSVIPGHIEQMKGIFSLPSTHWFPIPGKIGVILFFTLSGFLITSILIREVYQGNSTLGSFYERRAKRILPLYFLILLSSIFIFNNITQLEMPGFSEHINEKLTLEKAILLLILLPNFIGFIIPYAGHLWSLGVEEQFYLIQPIIIKKLQDVRIIVTIITIFCFFKESLSLLRYFYDTPLLKVLYYQSQFYSCIAIGSLSAIICYTSKRFVINYILTKKAIIISMFFLCYFLYEVNIHNKENIIDYRFYAIIFSIIIINSALRNDTAAFSKKALNHKSLNYIGEISYGVYMYHPVCIGISIAIYITLEKNLEFHVNLMNPIIYSSSIILTIIISHFSFYQFERKITNYKTSKFQ